jgi:hypothetical protein
MGETAPSMQTAPDGQPVQSFPTMRRGSQRLLGLVARRLSAEAQAAETATTQAPRYFTASALRNPIVGGACLTPRSRATAAARLVVESPCHPTSGLARSRVGRPAPGDAAWMWGLPTAQRRLFGFPWASGGTACCRRRCLPATPAHPTSHLHPAILLQARTPLACPAMAPRAWPAGAPPAPSLCRR